MASKPKAVGWALDNASVSVKTKPKRPYTPYNIFYLLERELMVQEPKAAPNDLSSTAAPTSVNLPSDNAEDKLKLPARYKGIVMGPQWYDPNCKEKRKHRKTHGKVSILYLDHASRDLSYTSYANCLLFSIIDFISRSHRTNL